MQTNNAMPRKVDVIAIHGVGNRKPVEVLNAAIRGLSKHCTVRSDKSAEHYRGQCYQYSEVHGHPVVEPVLEVNWDDISLPSSRQSFV